MEEQVGVYGNLAAILRSQKFDLVDLTYSLAFKRQNFKKKLARKLPGTSLKCKILTLASSILLASSMEANPPNTTEWIAPILAHP